MSSALPSGAGAVFEYDGETGYFYLFDMHQPDGSQIVAHIHIVSAEPGFGQDDLEIVWSAEDRYVGLTIKGALYAAFDTTTQERFGGTEAGFEIPDPVRQAF
ncbi:DUF2251 domain-containing protein [Terrihabitans soli]|uniref:DUF2251 domain-containing protein n=1 Tax=Terrihabitans soli TaxID=708113 RepID=UPI001CA38386|nr:DUF2251 domain-containing protein [Terrihabitans soli]